MDKQALSSGLLSRAATAASSRAGFAGRAKEIAGTRNVMSAMRGRPNIVLKRGEDLLKKVESKARGQQAKFQSAAAARQAPILKAASVSAFFDEFEKIGLNLHSIAQKSPTSKIREMDKQRSKFHAAASGSSALSGGGVGTTPGEFADKIKKSALDEEEAVGDDPSDVSGSEMHLYTLKRLLTQKETV